jgi:hypothetical protein
MASFCTTPSAQIISIDRAEGNDLTSQFSMRYKLASEPDSSYAPVTTTKAIIGITMPYFDIASVAPGTYVVHTYFTTDGPSTGTKVTIKVECDDDPGT